MTIDLNALEKEGWTRRFTTSEPRLDEAVQTYRDLGLEVLLVPILKLCATQDDSCAESSSGCTSCFEADDDPDRYKVIFTRPSKDGGENDELF